MMYEYISLIISAIRIIKQKSIIFCVNEIGFISCIYNSIAFQEVK